MAANQQTDQIALIFCEGKAPVELMAMIERAGQRAHNAASCRIGATQSRSFGAAQIAPPGQRLRQGAWSNGDDAATIGAHEFSKARNAGLIGSYKQPVWALNLSLGFHGWDSRRCRQKQNAVHLCCSIARERARNMQERPVPTDRAAFVLADLQAPLLIRDANGSPLRGRFGKSEVGVKRGLEKKASDADGAKDQRKRIAAEQVSRLVMVAVRFTPQYAGTLTQGFIFGVKSKTLSSAIKAAWLIYSLFQLSFF